MRYCVVAGAIPQWSHAPRLRISRGCSRLVGTDLEVERPYCVATARPRKQHEKEGNKRNKAKRTTTAHLFFTRDELARQGHVSGRARLRLLQGRARGKRESRHDVLVLSARQQLEYARLFSRMSRARLLESHRVELFHFQLQVPAGSTQGCGLCYALSGPPSWGTRAPVGSLASAPLPVWDGSHLTSPSSSPPSSCSVRTFPSRPLPPPSCCYTLRISYPIPPHRAAAKNFPGGSFANQYFSSSWASDLHCPPSFTKAAGRNWSNQFTISLGTNSRNGRIAPMSHRHQASLSLFPTALSLTLLLSAPARLSQQWAV